MTCPFCGRPDEQIGERHFERHKIEALRKIAKALEAMNEILSAMQLQDLRREIK